VAQTYRVFSIAVLFLMLAIGLNPISKEAAAQSGPPLPGVLGSDIRTSLFDAQQALFLGDSAGAEADVAAARTSLDQLFALPGISSADLAITTKAAEAAAGAAQTGDGAAFAIARAKLWTSLMQIGYDGSLAAVAAGDAAGAQEWLLLREFRPTTKFARPNADSTFALRDLSQKAITPVQAAAVLTADLLDTYQGLLDSSLTAVDSDVSQNLSIGVAEGAGFASGYWSLLAPAYETQNEAAARASIDELFSQLTSAAAKGDLTAVSALRPQIDSAIDEFRAAPLTEDEQARRAGQLLRYLSLSAVEFGRGVKNGQVLLDIEIQEAQAFLDGARASFNDLRSYLSQQDATKTAAIGQSLSDLDQHLKSAASHTNVVDAAVFKSSTSAMESTLKGLFPEAWSRPGGDADFDVISSILDQMESAVAAGQYTQAEAARLEAYAIYDAGPEKRLLAFNPSLAHKIEQLFWQGTGSIDGLAYSLKGQASSQTIREIRLELNKGLHDGQRQLGGGNTARAAIIFNSATIVFREGLEAVLILASLMASMVGVNKGLKRPLAIGGLVALIANVGLFISAGSILGSLGRVGEKLETVFSLVAIGVLLLVMNWFFHKVYWTKWIAGHHAKRRAIIGGAAGQLLGLAILGFTSVFREGAESVLFLQALVLDAGTWVVIQGTLLGLVGTAVVGALVFVMQKKLPHKKMLVITGVMIATVLVTMVGTTVHVLQVVGWITITPLGTLQLPYWTGQWIGLYATWEGALAQIVAFVFVVGSYYAAEFQHSRSMRRLEASIHANAQAAKR